MNVLSHVFASEVAPEPAPSQWPPCVSGPLSRAKPGKAAAAGPNAGPKFVTMPWYAGLTGSAAPYA